jgi:Kdo2-lipid IVA lauroyltransferase/acyltransferase
MGARADQAATERAPLRRRVRARALDALVSIGGRVPTPLLRGGLSAAARLAVVGRHAALTRTNLEAALGAQTTQAERARLARAVRRFAARQLAEWIRLARGAPPEGPRAARGRWIEELVELDPSIAILDEALARGRGAIVVTAHIGNWELLAARLRRRGHGGAVVGRERPRDPTADWLVRMRAAYGVTSLSQDSPPRRLLAVLREGQTLGILADLEVRRLSGAFLPFFGRPAWTMTAPAALARAAHLPLLPARCTAVDGQRYRLVFDEPLELDRGLDRREATLELSGRLAAVYERWVRANPEQWAWHQPRWRTQPQDPARPEGSHAPPLEQP